MKLEELVKKVQNQKEKRARLEGQLDTLMESLHDEGYSSTEEAIKEIKELEIKVNKRKKILSKKIDEFNKKYHQQLENA